MLETFLGVLIGFLIARISDWLNHIFQRQRKSYNELVALEEYLNNCHKIYQDRVDDVDAFIYSLEKKEIYLRSLKFFPIRDGVNLKLINLYFINDFYEFLFELKRFNDDFEMFNCWHKVAYTSFIDQKVPSDAYLNNLNNLKVVLEEFKGAFLKFEEKIIYQLAGVRILTEREKPIASKFIDILFNPKPVLSEERNEEIKKIKSEFR